MFRGDAAHTGIHPGPGAAGLPMAAWRVDLGGKVLGVPVVAGGLVAIPTITSEQSGEACVLHV